MGAFSVYFPEVVIILFALNTTYVLISTEIPPAPVRAFLDAAELPTMCTRRPDERTRIFPGPGRFFAPVGRGVISASGRAGRSLLAQIPRAVV